MTHLFSSARNFNLHQYVIIDRVLVKTLPDGVNGLEMVSPLLAPQAVLYPWLVPLSNCESHAWTWLMKTAQESHHSDKAPLSVMWVESQLPIEDVMSALVSTLYLIDDKQQGNILRYYDPRVLFHLTWMLTTEQLNTLLKAQIISCWTFWLEGQWHSLKMPGVSLVTSPAVDKSFPFSQLERIGMINAVLARLPIEYDMEKRVLRSQVIDKMLLQASACGLSHRADCIMFAAQGVIQGEQFWMLPSVRQNLALALSMPGYYSKLVKI